MGLDMYLKKTKKVEGFTAGHYQIVDNVISDLKTIGPYVLDLEAMTGLVNANELLDSINLQGESFHWYSIYNEVGYWRKANQIHQWFVDNVQGGIDGCDPYIVKKDKLEELLGLVNVVLADHSKTEELLPIQAGSGTDYDEYYFKDLEQTKEILEKVLKDTDFKREVILYRSFW